MEGTPPAGSDVRTVLTASEAIRQSEGTGEVTRNYAGRVVEVTDDSVSLSVVTLYVPSEVTGSRALRRTIAIPRSGIEELESRRLSFLRTGVLGLVTAWMVRLAINRVVDAGGNPEPGGGGEPTGGLVPVVIRIPVGR